MRTARTAILAGQTMVEIVEAEITIRSIGAMVAVPPDLPQAQEMQLKRHPVVRIQGQEAMDTPSPVPRTPLDNNKSANVVVVEDAAISLRIGQVMTRTLQPIRHPGAPRHQHHKAVRHKH